MKKKFILVAFIIYLFDGIFIKSERYLRSKSYEEFSNFNDKKLINKKVLMPFPILLEKNEIFNNIDQYKHERVFDQKAGNFITFQNIKNINNQEDNGNYLYNVLDNINKSKLKNLEKIYFIKKRIK